MGTQTVDRAIELVSKTAVSPSAKLVLLYLAHRTNEETGRCFPKLSTISTDLGITTRTVSYAILDLRGKLLLDRTRKGKINYYTIFHEEEKSKVKSKRNFPSVLEANGGTNRTRSINKKNKQENNKKSPSLAVGDSSHLETSSLGKGEAANIEERLERVEESLAKIAAALTTLQPKLTLAEKSTKILTTDKTSSIADPIKRSNYAYRRLLATEYPELAPVPLLTLKEQGFLKACVRAWGEANDPAEILKVVISHWDDFREFCREEYQTQIAGLPSMGAIVAAKGECLMFVKRTRGSKTRMPPSNRAKRWSDPK